MTKDLNLDAVNGALSREVRKLQEELKAADKANTRLTARVAELEEGLKRMLQEFDFLVEGGSLPDIRNDIIFDAARALLTPAPEKEPTNG